MSGYEWPSSLGMENVFTCEDRSELVQHNLRFSLTVSVKHAMMLQWWYPEIVLELRLHKFPEGTSIIILKALLDNRIYVLPPGTLLSFEVDLLNCLKVDHEPGSLLDFAFEYSLCFRCDFLRCSADIQGKF